MMLHHSLNGAKLLLLGLLVGCQPGTFDIAGTSGNGNRVSQQQALPKNPALSQNVNGEKIGSGPIRVALLVPATAAGGGGVAGKQIANAARLAMQDFGANRFQLVIKDTKGQASTAQSKTSEALQEGASLVLGPLFSGNVSSASAVSEPSKKPMIAFSSDTNRARAGVYLLSFAPQDDVARTINFGISRGSNRIVALLPQSAYGNLVERELRRVATQSGANVTAIARYKQEANSIIEAARSVALQVNESNAIFIPQGGKIPTLVIKTLKQSGVQFNGQQIMGSGQWESVDIKEPALEGAIFAGAEKSNFAQFSNRYQTKYGAVPTMTAALGYDAVSLAAELVRRKTIQPFSPAAIQSSAGFTGVTGLFRFKANGRLQRGLVINQIQGGQRIIASPAPRSFGPNS